MSPITRRAVAATELLLVCPAALFVAALFVRSIQSQELEPARSANQVVMWYVGLAECRLWGLLVTLPLAVLCLGGATLLQRWATDAELRHAVQQTLRALHQHMATAIVTAATFMAACILAIVVMHMLTN
jgi:hypothetical protein